MSTRRRRRQNKNQKKWTSWKDPRVGDMALWIMTPFGVLMPSKRPEKLLKDGDDRTLQVRARRAEYLDAFREHFCPELGANEHTPTQDYQWKAPVSPENLARAVARMVLEIDSEKFKPLAEGRKYSLKDHKLAGALHSMYTRLWSAQLSYGDGTSSYDKLPAYVPKGIDECVRLGHWWPAGKALCTDCGAERPAGSDTAKRGPSGVKPGKDEVAAWHKAHPAKPSYTIPGYPATGTGGSTGTLFNFPAKDKGYEPDQAWTDNLGSCARWGHQWKAGCMVCTYCDEPRPEHVDDDVEASSATDGTVYVDGEPVWTPDSDPAGWTHCQAYGHEWQPDEQYCDWCGEPRPDGFPSDADLTSDTDGYYYVDGILAHPGEDQEEEASGGEQAPAEMAAGGAAETEERAHA